MKKILHSDNRSLYGAGSLQPTYMPTEKYTPSQNKIKSLEIAYGKKVLARNKELVP